MTALNKANKDVYIDLLSKLHTSRAYSKVGKHFCFCYILPANGRTQTRKNDRKYILKQTKHQTKSQFVYKDMSHVTAGARCEVFDRSQKNESALAEANRLVKDRSRKSEAIQERSLSDLNSPLVDRGFS